MAIAYWCGGDSGKETDIDVAANYVDAPNGTNPFGSVPDGDDDVVFQSLALSNVADNPTVNDNITFNAIKIDSGCTLTGNASYSITVDGESDFGVLSALHAVYIAGILGTNVNVIIACNAVTSLVLNGSSGNLHNVTVDDDGAGAAYYMVADATIAGNLTITEGTLITNNNALTVTAQCLVNGGTLTLGSSTCEFGNVELSSGTINGNTSNIELDNAAASGYIWEQSGGTFNYDTSTVVCKESGKHIQGNNWYNLTISAPLAANAIHWRPASGGSTDTMTIYGDLLITEGIFRRATTTYVLVVDGDVTVQDGGTLGRTDLSESGANTFGSLTIASGGTYNATSGTTTITDENGDGYAWENQETDGTGFVHNNGLVKIALVASKDTWIIENTYYDLEISMYAAGNEVIWLDTTGNAVTVLGNLTITQGLFEGFTETDTLTVYGNTYIAANGKFEDNGDHTGQITHHGLVTNLGTYETSEGDKNAFNGGLRQLGIFNSNDTLTIGGVGGILEGNLHDANINVNTDPVLTLDGSADYLTAPAADFRSSDSAGAVTAWIKSTTGVDLIFSAAESSTGNFKIIIYANSNNLYIDLTNDGSAVYSLRTNTIPLQDGNWHHIAAVSDSTSNTIKLYIDGRTESLVGSGNNGDWFADLSTKAAEIAIGSQVGGGDYLAGSIADVRVYSATLPEADVKILASKINIDDSLTSIQAVNHWKLNLTDIDATHLGLDTGSAPINLTSFPSIVAGNFDYDAFSVNVQGQTTAGTAKFVTDGTMTVEQGKLEGLALTDVTFDGSTSYIEIESSGSASLTTDMADAMTVSAWVKPAALDSTTRIIVGNHKQAYGAGSIRGILLNMQATTGLLRFEMRLDNTCCQTVTSANALTVGEWSYVVGNWDGTNMKVYINGVLEGTTAAAGTNYMDRNLFIGTNADQFYNAGALTNMWNGSIRDVSFYDIGLSEAQVGSSYGNQLNITPNGWFKLDEGTGTNIEDSGSADVEATATDITWANGTLDLDSTLTIGDDGTLSAPKGTLDLSGDLDINGTYTHNSGTFSIDSTAGQTSLLFGSAVFYNLISTGSANSHSATESFSVENIFNPYRQFTVDDITLTMGTLAATGTISGNAAGFGGGDGSSYLAVSANDYLNLYAASELYPVKISNDCLNWGASTAPVWNLKWTNHLVDVDTQWAAWNSAVPTINLDGDCAFAGFEVAATHILDLKGKRMECSGEFTNSGTTNMGGAGSILQAATFNLDGTIDEEIGASFILNGGASNANNDFTNASFVGDDTTNIFVNNGATSLDWNGSEDYLGNLIVGSPFRSQEELINKCGNLIIPTGGALDAVDDTITVAGDFNSGGGLIGKSALDLDGTQYAAQSTKTDWGFTNDFTIETWLNTTDTDARFMDMANGSDGGDRISLSIESGELRIAITGSNVETSGYSAIVTGGKWVHAAFTYDGTDAQIYVNGKLAASSDLSVTRAADPDMEMWIGCGIDEAAGTFYTGKMGRFSLWSTVLSASDIRTMMFQKYSEATTTTCEAWYEFDEGTSTAVANSEGTAARAVTLNEAAWAGGGDFDYGSTSTVDLTGTGDLIVYNETDFYNLTLAAATKTTTLKVMGGYNINIVNNGTLTLGAGAFTDVSNNETLYLKAGSTLVNGGANLNLIYQTYIQTDNPMPECSYGYIFIDGSTSVTLGGNMTCPYSYMRMQGTSSLNFEGYTVETPRLRLSDAGTTLNIGSGSLVFNSTTGLNDNAAGTTLSAGPGAVISGTSAETTFISNNDWKVVGKCENLNVTTEELRVTGQVINCTGDIIQQHPSIDANQQLDYDTADDRDIQFGVPDLDKNTELVT